MPRTLRLSLALFLVAAGLAACGKRGQLEPPPAQKQAQETATPAAAESAAPEANRAGRPRRVPITAPKRELLIDRILD